MLEGRPVVPEREDSYSDWEAGWPGEEPEEVGFSEKAPPWRRDSAAGEEGLTGPADSWVMGAEEPRVALGVLLGG